MSVDRLEPRPEAAVADLSFRSMAGAAARILELVSGNELYGLIKPQFERRFTELENADGEFSGVVGKGETPAILRDVLERLAAEGIVAERLAPAGLRGRGGNQEYLALLRRAPAGADPAGLAGRGWELVRALPG
jgi:23S rRNA (cytidine1920-2'-O)/16S rRNA (cytidine1409-2'-O)-methyltransferase